MSPGSNPDRDRAEQNPAAGGEGESSRGAERGPRPESGTATRGDVAASVTGSETYIHGRAGAATNQATPVAAKAPPRGGRRRGGERSMVPRERPRSYYGQAVVKPPVWTWEIPNYLFVGGLGGVSSALAIGAEIAGNDRLARSAWAASLFGISASPLLLISDLGRPLRFLNMLRVVKRTSPMSIGSWILIANGATATPAAGSTLLGIGFPGARVVKALAGALGIPLATYTAVLLTNTVIPVWSEARWELPFVFAGSAAASAGGAACVLTGVSDAGPARLLAAGGAAVELGAVELMTKRLGELGEPYESGAAGRFSKAAKALTAAGGALVAGPGRSRRGAAVAGGAMLLAGSLCERWAVYKAGFPSAHDPRYTVGPQRARIS